jgi:hypothetical protein
MAYDLTPGYRPVRRERGAGSLLFAGTILGLIGFFNVIAGVSALSGSKTYPENTVYEFGNLKLWGGIVLAVGVVELVASVGIFSRNRLWVKIGVVVAAGNAVTQLLFIPVHPWWAVTAFAADLLVIRALLRYGASGTLSR